MASVKPGGSIFSANPGRSRGRFRWTTQLSYLIGYAYHLDRSRVSGPHLGSVYSVEATFDPAAGDSQVRLMVQSLLAERFKMRCHRATALADGFALVVAKGGIKMKEAERSGEPAPPQLGPYGSVTSESNIYSQIPQRGIVEVTGRNVSMAELATELQRSGTPVWDRTGLSGKYDFRFRYSENVTPDFDVNTPWLGTALRENLGLALRQQKGPVETLVIDSIEEPSEN